MISNNFDDLNALSKYVGIQHHSYLPNLYINKNIDYIIAAKDVPHDIH